MSVLKLGSSSPPPFVIVILDRAAPPQVRFLAELPERAIELDGESCLDAGLGDWIGFYDWLRTEPDTVIGVTLWPDTAHEHLASVGHCPGVESLHEGKELRIYFGDERGFHSGLSCDQDFGGNRLFVGTTRYAMSFNAPRPQTQAPVSSLNGNSAQSARPKTAQEVLLRLAGGFALLASLLAVADWTR